MDFSSRSLGPFGGRALRQSYSITGSRGAARSFGFKTGAFSNYGSLGAEDLHQSITQGFTFGNERVLMQQQNDRLASYIQKVRNLQEANEKLEEQIREALEKRGPTGIDYSHYDATLAELRDEILAMTKSNAALYLQIDNCNLSAQDFEMKLRYEQQVHQQVEADIHALRKVLDDTNVERLHLESDIESLNAALITLKKNHNQDVSELQAQIVQSGVKVDVDARKGQDLIKIMEEMRAKYERMALKNQEELKAWHESKITEVDIQVKENTLALKEANRQMTESQRTMNSLEIDLQALISLKASLEGTLNDTKLRYNMEIEKYNTIIHEREATLMELRSSIQQQKQECETLLNSNMKLEAEIATYRGHLDMGHVKNQHRTLEITGKGEENKILYETNETDETETDETETDETELTPAS